MSYINKYFGIAFTYGFLRKITYLNDIKEYTLYENGKKYVTPLLMTDSIFASIFGGFQSIYALPFFVLADIRNMEIFLKDKNKVVYNNEYTYSDILYNLHSHNYDLKEIKS
jgi:hypothetical protein